MSSKGMSVGQKPDSGVCNSPVQNIPEHGAQIYFYFNKVAI